MVTGRTPRGVLVALTLVLALHLGAQLAGPQELLRPTQVLLAPLLALALALAAPRPWGRLTRLVLLGLGFSWLGDTLPGLVPGDGAFLAMIGSFAVAQACYALAFWPYRGSGALRSPASLLYLGWAALLIVLVARGAGALLPAVVGYAALITLMAVLATGVHRLVATGAVLFVLSDSLIALSTFTDRQLPAHGFWVMVTYGVAQMLIVLGVLRRAHGLSRRAAP